MQTGATTAGAIFFGSCSFKAATGVRRMETKKRPQSVKYSQGHAKKAEKKLQSGSSAAAANQRTPERALPNGSITTLKGERSKV